MTGSSKNEVTFQRVCSWCEQTGSTFRTRPVAPGQKKERSLLCRFRRDFPLQKFERPGNRETEWYRGMF